MDWLRSVRAASWKSKFHAFPFFASRTLHCNAEILFHFQLTSLWKNFIKIFTLEKKLACEQALQGALATGRQKEGELATHLWNLNICIKIVNAKCWLVKMTLAMTLFNSWHIFFNVCLNLCLFLLRADCQKSDSSVDREPQWNWRWNSNSRDIT